MALTRQTLGGLQFWTDHVYRQGYRIQQHALTHHWRLIDERSRRVVSGCRNDCETRLEQISPLEIWNQFDTPFVVLVHGLMRTAHCMRTLQRWLKNSGFENVLRFAYASTRASILDHADALVSYVESLPNRSQLSFVCHSMGSIVLRAAIGQTECSLKRSARDRNVDNESKDSLHRKSWLSRLHRVVMLGPPNHGSVMARRLAKTGVFGLVNGPGALELGPRWPAIADSLATPPCPFAIVAGDRSSGLIQNPLIHGPNDYLVGVNEAMLEGAREFVTLPVPHATLMTDARSLDFATQFLKQA